LTPSRLRTRRGSILLSLSLSAPETTSACLGRRQGRQQERKGLCRSDKIASQ
jgi:hypothetical protein